MVRREVYLKKLRGYKDKQLIKVVTGIRRCGKSTLLEMFRNELLEQGVSPDRFISVNFEDMDNSHLLEPELLHQYITERLSKEMTYVFLDEVQLVGEFEKVIEIVIWGEFDGVFHKRQI